MSDTKYDFLTEEAPAPAVPETVAEPVAVATVETPAVPVTAVPTTAEPREETHVPLAALKAEREKRQQYERELQQLRQQAQQPPPEPVPFFEAPEQYVQQAVQQVRNESRQVFFAALEQAARDQHADFDEVIAEVEQAGNPALIHQIFSAANPAIAAYKLGKQLREMKAMKDPAAYRAGVEAEVRAKLEAEYAAKDAAAKAAAAAIPPDLSAARSARDLEVVEPDTLDSILASRRKR